MTFGRKGVFLGARTSSAVSRGRALFISSFQVRAIHRHTKVEDRVEPQAQPEPFRGDLAVNLMVVSDSSRERDELIARGMNGSALQHHPMFPDGSSDANYARYKCGRCGMTFVVGYRAVAVPSGPQKLELVDRTSLDTACPGLFAVHGELRSESASDAQAIDAVADALSEANAHWTVHTTERPRHAYTGAPLRTISWVWESQDPSASAEQAMEVFQVTFNSLYPGRPLPAVLWTSRPNG